MKFVNWNVIRKYGRLVEQIRSQIQMACWVRVPVVGSRKRVLLSQKMNYIQVEPKRIEHRIFLSFEYDKDIRDFWHKSDQLNNKLSSEEKKIKQLMIIIDEAEHFDGYENGIEQFYELAQWAGIPIYILPISTENNNEKSSRI